MQTNRDFLKKRENLYIITETFKYLNEKEKFNLGEELYRKGIETIYYSYLEYKENFFFFDFKLLEYFIQIKCVHPFYNEIPFGTKYGIKDFRYLKKFIDTLEELTLYVNSPIEDLEILSDFPNLLAINIAPPN